MTALPTDHTDPPFGRRRGSIFDDDFFTLGAPVGPGQPNRREDVIKVETIFGNTGDHDIQRSQGPVGYWGEPQERSVRTFQGKNGLKVDGLLNPGGPTITSVKRAASGLLSGHKPPTPAEVDEHHARLGRGEPPLLNIRPARLSIRVPEQVPELDEQSQAFNADTARALTRSHADGDVPAIYADHLGRAGADGHTTVIDLVEQVHASQGRDRADRLLHSIVGRLAPEQAREVLGGGMPARRPLGVRTADLPNDDRVPLFARATAEPATKDQTPAAAPPAAGQQVAAAPPQDPLGQKGGILEGGGGKGIGGGIGGGAAIGTGIAVGQTVGDAIDKTKQWLEGLWTGGPGQGQNTTAAPPQVPTNTPGPDITKPQPQQGTPPSTPPKPVPPGPPPSTPQKPPAQGGTLPGRPAKPVPPMGPVEIKERPQVNLSNGGKPYKETEDAIAAIPDRQAQEAIRGIMLGNGITNGADEGGTHIVIEDGNYNTAKHDHQKLVESLDIDPSTVRDLGNKGGSVATTKDGRIEVIVRPTSGKDEPTLEVQAKDEEGNVIHRFKRRYGRRLK